MTKSRTKLDPRFDEYIKGVLSRQIVTGRLVQLAVERHVRDVETAADRGLFFDAEEANFAVDFIECLKQSKDPFAGQPLRLEPWQVFIVGSLSGWMIFDAKFRSSSRRFRHSFVSVAKKNGKSTLAAAMGHKLAWGDGVQGAEVYTLATKLQQARIVHEEARRMALQSPSLRKMLTIQKKNLSCEESGSKYEPLGADVVHDEGINPSAALIDELHLHETRAAWDMIDASTITRRNPLLFCITTAGDAGQTESIYHELKDYTIQVLEGTLSDERWFGFIATLDKKGVAGAEADDDWTDERLWVKANPNLGVSLQLETLREKAVRARKIPAEVASFRRRHCNQDTYSLTPWVDVARWNACPKTDWYDRLGLRPEVIEAFRGRECAVGCDLSSVSDLTAMVFAFPAEQTGGIDVLPFAWCPRENAVGRQRDKRVPYLEWAEAGQLFLTEGDSVDYDALRALLRRARDDWGWVIRRIAFDPTNARYLVTKLVEEDGWRLAAGEGKVIDGEVYERLQTTAGMNDPIGLTEKLLLDKRLRHGGHQPLAWCVGNVIVWTDTGGRRRFDKKKGREKIDLAVALVMAVSDAMQLRGGAGVGMAVL